MKFFLRLFILLTFIFINHVSFAKESVAYHCKVSQYNGRDLIAKGSLSFADSIVDNRRTLTNIKAEITTDWAAWGDLKNEDSYRGSFEIESLVENRKYRPIRYKNHSQFKNFDARIADMWGNLIVEKNSSYKSEIEVHYIFQAGDHMGGTIDFICLAD